MIAGGIVTSQKSNTPSIASSTTALAANTARIAWSIQNLGQNALFVRLGAGATTSLFHFVLKAGGGNDDGTGGSVAQESGAVFNGIITLSGTTPRYTVLEIAP